MKKILLLCLLVFGINTAVNAQTRLQFTDNNGVVVKRLEFEKTLTKDEVKSIFNDLGPRQTMDRNRQVGGSFRLDVWYQYYPGHWSHEYGGPFYWYEGETLGDIIDRIIDMYF